MRLLAALAVLLSLSGCLAPAPRWYRERQAQRQYCAQAAAQGWCSPICGRRQPPECWVTYKLIPRDAADRSRFLCMYQGSDGSLAFSPCPEEPKAPPGLRYRAQGTAMFPVQAWIGQPCAEASTCPPAPGLQAHCFVPVAETVRSCVYELS